MPRGLHITLSGVFYVFPGQPPGHQHSSFKKLWKASSGSARQSKRRCRAGHAGGRGDSVGAHGAIS